MRWDTLPVPTGPPHLVEDVGGELRLRWAEGPSKGSRSQVEIGRGIPEEWALVSSRNVGGDRDQQAGPKAPESEQSRGELLVKPWPPVSYGLRRLSAERPSPFRGHPPEALRRTWSALVAGPKAPESVPK